MAHHRTLVQVSCVRYRLRSLDCHSKQSSRHHIYHRRFVAFLHLIFSKLGACQIPFLSHHPVPYRLDTLYKNVAPHMSVSKTCKENVNPHIKTTFMDEQQRPHHTWLLLA